MEEIETVKCVCPNCGNTARKEITTSATDRIYCSCFWSFYKMKYAEPTSKSLEKIF